METKQTLPRRLWLETENTSERGGGEGVHGAGKVCMGRTTHRENDVLQLSVTASL